MKLRITGETVVNWKLKFKSKLVIDVNIHIFMYFYVKTYITEFPLTE